jgi:hypothetical protein
VPDRHALPLPPAHRSCPTCGLLEGMKLQNSGVFSLHYLCEACGTSLTLPPPQFIVPPSTFER